MPLRKILSNFFSVMHIQFSCGSRQSRAAAKTFCPIFFQFYGHLVFMGRQSRSATKHILSNFFQFHGHVVFMGRRQVRRATKNTFCAMDMWFSWAVIAPPPNAAPLQNSRLDHRVVRFL